MERWEYLVVIFQELPKRKPHGGFEDTFRHAIHRAGRKTEWRSGRSWIELLDELGGRGWIHTSEVVLSSTVAPLFGLDEVSLPVRTRHTFRRKKAS